MEKSVFIILTSETEKCCDWPFSLGSYETQTPYFKSILCQGSIRPVTNMVFSKKYENFRVLLTKYTCGIISILLKNGEICSQQLKHLQGHPHKESTFSNPKQVCKYWRLSPFRPFWTGKYHPDVATWKAFSNLHTLSNIRGQWPSSFIQR